jgi:hypothetical protein
MRYDRRRGGWKLIEIHARLGEDHGLAALMSDEDLLAVIERACAPALQTPVASKPKICTRKLSIP